MSEKFKNFTRTEKEKFAVVSYSGGMDSTCLLLYLLSKGYMIKAISFDYGQSHSLELKRAKKIVKYLQNMGMAINHQIINLQDAFSDSQSSLVLGEHAPEGHYEDESMKATVVENRNVIFSAITFGKALGWAKMNLNSYKRNLPEDEARKISKVVISLGVHAGDHSIYPDCTEESVEMAKELYRISNWDSDLVEYDTPFVNFSKAEVLNVGISSALEIGMSHRQITMIFKNTVSCYNANEKGVSCGKCGTCTERLEAFWNNNLNDPAPYVDANMGKKPKNWNYIPVEDQG
jgi:7-cyano-7-deazaguanine synthase